MGVQFEQITVAPPFSLTQVVEDAAFLRRQGSLRAVVAGTDPAAWMNALQRQSTPLVQSEARRADLEAWLQAAEAATR
jgi:hypothetical protein